MGRNKKEVLFHDIDRRETGYYSTPDFVAEYLSSKLMKLNPKGISVLDPCCGREELLEGFIRAGKQVTGIDIIRYNHHYRISFIRDDFINLYEKWKGEGLPLYYDYYIANPPYNCHEVEYIKANKKKLSKIFEDVGTYNMYSMFISAIIDCAKEGALIGLVTLDSFLTSKYHEKLRSKILDKCAVHEIILCPTDLFLDQGADVRTSIVILQKGKKFQREVYVKDRCRSTEELKQILKNNEMKSCALEDIVLHLPYDNKEFVIACPDDVRNLFRNIRLGDRFKCVTGISTGNDAKYLSQEKKEPYTIPFYKNPGKDRFFTDKCLYLDKNFLEYDKKIKNFIVRNKHLLFQEGISCSSMGVAFTACYLPPGSTYGVNANIICRQEDIWWLLAYLNSRLVTYFVRGVLLRSNMVTSGYVARIPLLDFSFSQICKLDGLAREAFDRAAKQADYDDLLDMIDEIVFEAAKISAASMEKIVNFTKNLIKNT